MAAVLDLLENRDRARALAREARRRALQRFRLDVIAREYRRLWESLLGPREAAA